MALGLPHQIMKHGMFKNREIMGSYWDIISFRWMSQQHDAGLSKHNPLNSSVRIRGRNYLHHLGCLKEMGLSLRGNIVINQWILALLDKPRSSFEW